MGGNVRVGREQCRNVDIATVPGKADFGWLTEQVHRSGLSVGWGRNNGLNRNCRDVTTFFASRILGRKEKKEEDSCHVGSHNSTQITDMTTRSAWPLLGDMSRSFFGDISSSTSQTRMPAPEIDPADGALCASEHDGLGWWSEEFRVQRIANYQEKGSSFQIRWIGDTIEPIPDIITNAMAESTFHFGAF
uniref:Uncharacterized protein n=1 Tax=Oryza glumipatula TaxID=40148 RepID=A0A0E0AEH0_9ORYZ